MHYKEHHQHNPWISLEGYTDRAATNTQHQRHQPQSRYLGWIRIRGLDSANVNACGCGEVDPDQLGVVHACRIEQVTLDVDVHHCLSAQSRAASVTHLENQLSNATFEYCTWRVQAGTNMFLLNIYIR